MKDDEELAQRIVSILGESSSASKALKELEARREAGEDVVITLGKSSSSLWLVGPRRKRMTDLTMIGGCAKGEA